MPQLDFKEIAQANVASGEQDTFELLAREFLELRGYKVLSGPDRGSDLGRDLIVLETRTGVGGETHIRWLVSCKHKAHSGQSVGLGDEQDIVDRVQTHSCAGFIGFYSTLPGSSLTQKLAGIKSHNAWFDFQFFDREYIERYLLSGDPIGQSIAERYFPRSFNNWRKENFDISLALARIGMPQPVAYKLPGEDKVFTVEEMQQLYPQGNKYLFDVMSPYGHLIFCNNILGVTKVLIDGKFVDPPSDYFEKRTERLKLELEAMRQHMLQDSKNADSDISTDKLKSDRSTNKRKTSKQRIAKESRKRNKKR